MNVPVVRRPLCRIRKKRLRISHLRAVLLTQLLSKLRCSNRTDLHALAAGHAFCPIHMCAIGRAGQIRRVVELRGTDCIAHARGTVTDSDNLILSVYICDLMNKAVPLGTLQKLHDFIIGSIPSRIPRHAEFRHVSDTDAEFSRNLTITFAAHFLLFPAGAESDGILIILVEPMREMLDTDRLILRLNCLLHRNHMHTDSGSPKRHHGGHSLERHLRHQIEEACKIRMRLRQRFLHHHELSGARHEDRNIVLKMMILILTVQLHDTGPDQMINDFLRLFHRHVIFLRKLLHGIVHAGFAEAEHKFCLFLRQHLIQRPVLRIIRLHGMLQLHRIAIGDHLTKPLDQFLFLLVRRSVAMDLFIISFIGHAVLLFFHDSVLLLPIRSTVDKY